MAIAAGLSCVAVLLPRVPSSFGLPWLCILFFYYGRTPFYLYLFTRLIQIYKIISYISILFSDKIKYMIILSQKNIGT
jgi:hypothetical protein